MRVLLDESLPRQFKAQLSGHEVLTVPEVGWAGKKNGELLRLADARFDVFVTADAHLPEQQNLSGLKLGVVFLFVPGPTTSPISFRWFLNFNSLSLMWRLAKLFGWSANNSLQRTTGLRPVAAQLMIR